MTKESAIQRILGKSFVDGLSNIEQERNLANIERNLRALSKKEVIEKWLEI